MSIDRHRAAPHLATAHRLQPSFQFKVLKMLLPWTSSKFVASGPCCGGLLSDKLRASRHTTLGVSEGKATMLGVKGEPFKFTQCANVAAPVECSVSTGKVGDIESFIRQHVRA